MVDGLDTASCFSLVDVVSRDAPPPESPGGSPTLLSLACGGASSQRLPVMETISGRKLTVVSVDISSIHLTVRCNCEYLPENLVEISFNYLHKSFRHCGLVV